MTKFKTPREKRREIQIGMYHAAKHALRAIGIQAVHGWGLWQYDEEAKKLRKIDQRDEFETLALETIDRLVNYTKLMAS